MCFASSARPCTRQPQQGTLLPARTTPRSVPTARVRRAVAVGVATVVRERVAQKEERQQEISWSRLPYEAVQEPSVQPHEHKRAPTTAWEGTQGSALLSTALISALDDHEQITAYPGAPSNVRIAVKLLEEIRRGDKSHFAASIKSLPQPHLCPTAFDRESLRHLQYSPAYETVTEYKKTSEAAWEALCAAGVVERLSLMRSELEWAMLMVQSPCLCEPILGCHISWFNVDMRAESTHGLTSPAASPFHHAAVSRAVETGEQLLLTTGEHSNDDFFLKHGVVVLGNPADTFVLFRNLRHLVIWYLESVANLVPARKVVRVLHTSVAKVAAAALFEAELRAGEQEHHPPDSLPVVQLSHQGPPQTPQQVQQRYMGPASLRPYFIPGRNPNTTGINLAGVARVHGGFRSHTAELETETSSRFDCPPELIVRADGRVDVRLMAALQHLAIQCATVTDLSSCGCGGECPTGHPSSSTSGDEDDDSTCHIGDEHAPSWGSSGPTPSAARQAAIQATPPWYSAVGQRCAELLAAFPTTVEEDGEVLEGLEKQRLAGGLGEVELRQQAQLALVVQYRMAKKHVLQQLLCHIAMLDAHY